MELSEVIRKATASLLLMNCTSKHLFNQMSGVGIVGNNCPFSCHVRASPLCSWFSRFWIVLRLTMCFDIGFVCGFGSFVLTSNWNWTVDSVGFAFTFALGVSSLVQVLDFLGFCKWVQVGSWGFMLGAWVFNKFLKTFMCGACGLK